jgi:hypothetical protein
MTCEGGRAAITDILLLLVVVGVVVIALAVDVAAVVGWLRRQWR